MSAQTGGSRGGSMVAGVEVRILKSEAHSLTSTPTQYPVEDANSIIDHVMLNPNVVQIQCEMPNTNSGTEKARRVMQDFNEMRESRKVMDLVTEHALYKNMILISVHPVHQAPYKGALILDMVFHQVGVIGRTGLVSAAGGRSPGLLSPDGTQATACGYRYAGECRPATDGALFDKCADALGGYSA